MKKKSTVLVLLAMVFFCRFTGAEEVVITDPLNAGAIALTREGGYVIDRDLNSVCVYSPSGSLLAALGRAGEGPGDIKRLGGFAVHPSDQTIYITETLQGNPWISRFAPDGRWLGEWKTNIDRQTWNGVQKIQWLPNNAAFLELVKFSGRVHKNAHVFTQTTAIFKISPNGELQGEYLRFSNDLFAEKPQKGNITVPFVNTVAWIALDDRILALEANGNAIRVIGPNGAPERLIPLPVERARLSAADIDAWMTAIKQHPDIVRREKEGGFDLSFWRENLPFPEYKPVCGPNMIADPAGSLYIDLYPPNEPAGQPLWCKVDIKTGKVTARFRIQGSLWAVRDGYCYIRRADTEENLVIARIPEKELF